MALFILSAALSANPITMIMSEVWFTDSGHCMVEIYPESVFYFNYWPIYIYDGTTRTQIPYDFSSVPEDSVLVLDFTTLMPELSFNLQNGTIALQLPSGTDYGSLEGVSWGESFSNTINSPLPGQSMAQWTNNHGLPEGNRYTWYKDMPPTPGICHIVARDTLHITVIDQSSNPVPNMSLYYYERMYPYTETPYGITDNQGVFADTVLAGRWQIVIKNPQTGDILFNQPYWLEPNQTTNITVQINYTSNNDEVQPILKKGLQAYPIPFNLQTANAITFKYDGEAKLGRESYIRLYDAKGRFVTQVNMDSKGTASWHPASGIGSGLYLARLISGNRIVDTTTLSIIK